MPSASLSRVRLKGRKINGCVSHFDEKRSCSCMTKLRLYKGVLSPEAYRLVISCPLPRTKAFVRFETYWSPKRLAKFGLHFNRRRNLTRGAMIGHGVIQTPLRPMICSRTSADRAVCARGCPRPEEALFRPCRGRTAHPTSRHGASRCGPSVPPRLS